jgi:hypothetical protein
VQVSRGLMHLIKRYFRFSRYVSHCSIYTKAVCPILTLRLTVERKVIRILRDQHMSQQPRACESAIMGRAGAGACTIVSQALQLSFGRTWRRTLTPCFIATRATEEPASRASSTISRRSSALRRRRREETDSPPPSSASAINTSSRRQTTPYTRPTPHAYNSPLRIVHTPRSFWAQ